MGQAASLPVSLPVFPLEFLIPIQTRVAQVDEALWTRTRVRAAR